MPVNPELQVEFELREGLVCADQFIDICARLCPMTFVHTRLALDRMAPGQVLEVRLMGDEPLRNVPRTCLEQGHEVLGLHAGPGEASTLFIRKRRAGPA